MASCSASSAGISTSTRSATCGAWWNSTSEMKPCWNANWRRWARATDRPSCRSQGSVEQRIERLLQASYRNHLQACRRFLGGVALGHDGALEAMLGGFLQALLTAWHRAHLAR